MTAPYNPYPSAPPPGAGWQQPPAVRGPRPQTVDYAFLVMVAEVVLSIVSIAITLANKDEIKQKILDKTPTTSSSALDAAINVGVGFSVVILLFYAALALLVRTGKNWARVVTWVFAGLGVLGLLLSFAQPTVAASRAVTVIAGLLDIALIVLLALKPSNDYFRKRPAQY